jgi:hypothetical protein
MKKRGPAAIAGPALPSPPTLAAHGNDQRHLRGSGRRRGSSACSVSPGGGPRTARSKGGTGVLPSGSIPVHKGAPWRIVGKQTLSASQRLTERRECRSMLRRPMLCPGELGAARSYDTPGTGVDASIRRCLHTVDSAAWASKRADLPIVYILPGFLGKFGRPPRGTSRRALVITSKSGWHGECSLAAT